MHQRGAHGGGGGSHGGDEGGGGGGGGGDGSRLVKVAFARTQPEAEMLQGLLAEADIPSVLHRILPIAGAYFMPGPATCWSPPKPRRGRARCSPNVHRERGRGAPRAGRGTAPRPRRNRHHLAGRLAFWIIAVAIAAFLLVWLLYQARPSAYR